MKIAIIGHKKLPFCEGGIEKGVEETATRMVKKGHEVIAYNRNVIHLFEDKREKKLKEYKGIRIKQVPTIGGVLCVPIYSFLAIIHAAFKRCDVVSIRASGSCAMIPLAKILGLKVIASLHGIDSKRNKWTGFASKYLEFGEKMAATKADACLVLSNDMKKYIDEKYGANSILFANGIDDSIYVEPKIIKDKYNLNKDDYILYLGRIVPEKRIEYLIEAYKKCNTNKKLVIVGDKNSHKGYFDYLFDAVENNRNIIFTGVVFGRELKEFHSNAYVFVLPSDLEGMSNALLESMSYGNCCLVSNIAENADVVKEKGIVFKKGDINDLQNKLQILLDNSNLVYKYKNESKQYILRRYNWDIVVEQMLRIFSGDFIDYQTILDDIN